MKIFIIILAIIFFIACIVCGCISKKNYNNLNDGIFPKYHINSKNLRRVDIFLILSKFFIVLSILAIFIVFIFFS